MTTQPLCLRCSQRTTSPTSRGACHAWACCLCGESTTAGIYIRIDPASVPYPSED